MEHDGRAVRFVITIRGRNHRAVFGIVGSKESEFLFDERERIVFVFMGASGFGPGQGDDEIIVVCKSNLSENMYDLESITNEINDMLLLSK